MLEDYYEDERSKETQQLPAIKDPRHETTRKISKSSSSSSNTYKDKTLTT